MRAVVEHARERLARDHLAAGGPDEIGELRDETVSVALDRYEDAIGPQRLDVLDSVVLANLRSRRRSGRRQAANQARGLDGTVMGMRDRTVEATGCGTRNFVEPLRVEPVLSQRLVLEPDALSLLVVAGEAVAAAAM